MRLTEKIKANEIACCHECGSELSGNGSAFKWAREHAIKTGHSPTVEVSYDIWATFKLQEKRRETLKGQQHDK